jgi:predicted RNase H-like nuclease
MKHTFFVGIDLAWSKRNDTGLCIISLEKNNLKHTACSILKDLDDIVAIITQTVLDNPCIIGIDAPLTVKNDEGRRDAEHELQKRYYKSHAVAHPANRNRLGLWNQGVPRGEELVRSLESFGFEENPHIQKGKICSSHHGSVPSSRTG